MLQFIISEGPIFFFLSFNSDNWTIRSLMHDHFFKSSGVPSQSPKILTLLLLLKYHRQLIPNL